MWTGYLGRILLFGAETWTGTEREDCKVQAVEMKFLRGVLNETEEGRMRNTNIAVELGVDEINDDIQKSRLRWFEHVMWM